MNGDHESEVTIWLQGEYFGVEIKNPTEEQVTDLMESPEKYNRHPLTEDIDLTSSIRSKEKKVRRNVYLYFDHDGKVYFGYYGGQKPYKRMRDRTSSSEEIVKTFGVHGDDGWVFKKNMVSVEIALPYILEFCRTGEIDTSTEEWEDNIKGN